MTFKFIDLQQRKVVNISLYLILIIYCSFNFVELVPLKRYSVLLPLQKGKCYFLCLETKKVTKENSRLQIILHRFFLPLGGEAGAGGRGG